MKIPLTHYGWPQVVVVPVTITLIMIIIALCAIYFSIGWVVLLIESLLACILIWSLAFFRDPPRTCPSDENLLLAPADGKVTDIEIIEADEKMLRIGIFLSIFNVHINRAPCNVRVEKITYKEGKYKNALNPESSRVNESNELLMTRISNSEDKLIVKQISGAIARRIVCKASIGQELSAGEKFGMIKFGSRTELYVPLSSSCVVRRASCEKTQYAVSNTQYAIKCLVRKGDKVKAGLTPLARFEKCPE